VLFGCTEEPDDTDCLTPLQNTPRFPSTVSKVNIQEPVEVVSNEVKVESPTLPDLGAMKLSFDVNVILASQATTLAPTLRAKCASEKADSIECAVFHYKIGNSSTRAVILAQDCGSEPFPEYFSAGEWHPVFQTLGCSVNVTREIPILPGGVFEEDFSLAWGYNISPFRAPGEYTFRLTFHPPACFASPDGRFCLTKYQNEAPMTSGPLTVRTQ
jgi:hypothetical protein